MIVIRRLVQLSSRKRHIIEETRMRRSLSVFLGLFCLSLTLLGCSGGRPAGAHPTKPVKVTVTYKGAPVADATISFVPDATAMPPAFGKTDAQGVAKMKTYVEGDGAVVGQHKISIIKSETTSSGPVTDQDSPNYVPPAGGGAPPPVVKYIIPQKYSSPASSGLAIEVKDSGPNEFTFDLKD
jgi:hypothetical protein